jgi:hypothetical protein
MEMIMKKINDRMFEFWNLDYDDYNQSFEDLIDSDEIESDQIVEPVEQVSVDISVEEFVSIMRNALDNLSVEECAEIGLF